MPEEVQNEVVEEQVSTDSLEEQDIKLFNDKGTKIPPVEEIEKPLKEVKPIKEEEEEEEEEVKEEEEPEEEEDLELTPLEGFTRPKFKDITKEYPDFFKKFPDMRDVIGHEHEFMEIFGGVEEARAAKENDKDFTFFSDKVTAGDAKAFLEVIKDAGKTDMGQFVSNFLPALKELDNNLYMETTAPLFVDILQNAYNDSTRAGNENLKNAVLHISQYLFNDHRFATGEVKLKTKEKAPEESKEKDELKRERESLAMERYTGTMTEIESNVSGKLEEFVNNDLPEGLNEFTSNALVVRIIKEADQLLGKDLNHQHNMARLWKLAESTKYDFAAKQRIITAVMNRYKEVIPEIRRKNIALATKGTNVRTEPRREVTSGSRNSGKAPRRVVSAKEVDWHKTSDEDLFSGNATYKS